MGVRSDHGKPQIKAGGALLAMYLLIEPAPFTRCAFLGKGTLDSAVAKRSSDQPASPTGVFTLIETVKSLAFRSRADT